MTTQSTIVRPHYHRLIVTFLGLAFVLTIAVSGGLLLGRPAHVAIVPTPVIAPATRADHSATNRFFAAEIIGAEAPDLSNAASGAQPDPAEYRSRVGLQPTTPQRNTFGGNRLFADDAHSGVVSLGTFDWSAPQTEALLLRSGKR